ncbi:hypothetical protein [Streptomyces cacaoi]|uniref:hypothetical protein n=1 Tax=Streptomyces cacaoi TaxID=1898 RepID=UPI0037483B5F
MSALDTGPPVPPSPRTARATVTPVPRNRVSGLEPTPARIRSYHLGFTDEHGAPRVADGGKPTRAGPVRAGGPERVLAAPSTGGPAGERLDRLWHADDTTAAHLEERPV